MGGSPPGARASRPQPYSCKQPAIQGHSLEQCTKPAFAGFATMAPSPMRARRPRSRVGPARNLIRASSLRSRGIPSNSAPNPPLQGSLLWRQVLCGRDARAPGWAFSHSLLLLKRACRVAGPQPCRADHAREPLAILAVGQVILPVNVIFCLFQYRVRPGEKGEFTTKSTKVTKRIS